MSTDKKQKSKKGQPYSEQELDFIRSHWQQMTDKEIGECIGRPAGGITAQRRKLGLSNYSRSEWTPREEQIVEELYAEHENETILEKLPRHGMQALYSKAQALGLKKTEAFMQPRLQELGKALAESDAAKASRFSKGHKSFNKGRKQEDWMSAEAIEATKATRFEKGHTPANTKWDGAITVRHHHKDRGERPSVWIRLSQGEWEPYRRHQYKKHIGPIPEGMLVALKDGNPFNCYPENLELITRAENARRNQDYEKSAQSLREYWQDNEHPARDLSDNYVAALLAGGDSELKEYIMTERPDLIQAARANYKLKREIREADDE